jgi:hypothetical protein
VIAAVDAAQNASAPSPQVFATTAGPPPIAAYNFDEGSGTVLIDRTGNGANGTIQGAPSWAAGKYGLAISYDGVNDNVLVGDLPQLDGASRITVSAWMKRAAAGDRVLVGKQVTGHDVAIEMWSDGRLYFQLSNGADAHGSIPLDDTSWHHVTLVFDGTQAGNAARLKGYVDGAPVTLTFSGTVPSTTTSNATPINLGTVGGALTRGLVDDVRIYNRALTSTEILLDMNSPL